MDSTVHEWDWEVESESEWESEWEEEDEADLPASGLGRLPGSLGSFPYAW